MTVKVSATVVAPISTPERSRRDRLLGSRPAAGAARRSERD
ncbi:hypothetical protein [Blastococcus jejuensis]